MTRWEIGRQTCVRQRAGFQALRPLPWVSGLRLELVVEPAECYRLPARAVGQLAELEVPANGRDPQQLFTRLIGSRTDALELDGFLLRIPDGVGR